MGATCSSDGECSSGLCIAWGIHDVAGNGCNPSRKICTISCASEMDCWNVDTKFNCFSTCDGAAVCANPP